MKMLWRAFAPASCPRLLNYRSAPDSLYHALCKEIPHNMGGSLAGDFQPSAPCKTLDYPPGNLRFLQATAD